MWTYNLSAYENSLNCCFFCFNCVIFPGKPQILFKIKIIKIYLHVKFSFNTAKQVWLNPLDMHDIARWIKIENLPTTDWYFSVFFSSFHSNFYARHCRKCMNYSVSQAKLYVIRINVTNKWFNAWVCLDFCFSLFNYFTLWFIRNWSRR